MKGTYNMTRIETLDDLHSLEVTDEMANQPVSLDNVSEEVFNVIKQAIPLIDVAPEVLKEHQKEMNDLLNSGVSENIPTRETNFKELSDKIELILSSAIEYHNKHILFYLYDNKFVTFKELKNLF